MKLNWKGLPIVWRWIRMALSGLLEILKYVDTWAVISVTVCESGSPVPRVIWSTVSFMSAIFRRTFFLGSWTDFASKSKVFWKYRFIWLFWWVFKTMRPIIRDSETIIKFLLASVPPVSRDALTHHLVVPKLYLQHGKMVELPAIPFSYYPMNLDLLYILPLYFGNDIVPKFIHFLFALMTAGLLFGFLKKRSGTLYALFGCLMFLSTPVIVKLSITVYVDLGLVFFSTAALIYLIKWSETDFCFFLPPFVDWLSAPNTMAWLPFSFWCFSCRLFICDPDRNETAFREKQPDTPQSTRWQLF